jgi:hypothetical protein
MEDGEMMVAGPSIVIVVVVVVKGTENGRERGAGEGVGGGTNKHGSVFSKNAKEGGGDAFGNDADVDGGGKYVLLLSSAAHLWLLLLLIVICIVNWNDSHFICSH